MTVLHEGCSMHLCSPQCRKFYFFIRIELVPHSNEEEQLFKISVDDIQCNCRLSKALVSFHCLEILEEIGHG